MRAVILEERLGMKKLFLALTCDEKASVVLRLSKREITCLEGKIPRLESDIPSLEGDVSCTNGNLRSGIACLKSGIPRL